MDEGPVGSHHQRNQAVLVSRLKDPSMRFFGSPCSSEHLVPDRPKDTSLRFRASDLTRALRAAAKAGLTVAKSEIAPDGLIRLVYGADAADGSFEAWKERRDARSAKRN